jgi:hypothetical protein
MFEDSIEELVTKGHQLDAVNVAYFFDLDYGGLTGEHYMIWGYGMGREQERRRDGGSQGGS